MQNRTKALCIIVLFVAVLGVASPVSANGDESPQSITFCETLPDDVLFYPDKESHGSGFAESFADVSDWTLSVGNAPTSDGDLMEWAVPGDDGYDTIYSNVPSLAAGYYYFEVGGLANVSGGRMVLYVYTSDDMGGTVINIGTFWPSISTTTFKVGFNAPSGVECFRFYAKSSSNILFQPDFLRISPSDEMGWQHDGSTTEGVSLAPLAYEEDMSDVSDWESYGTDASDSWATDGDILSMECEQEGGSGNDYDAIRTALSSVIFAGYYLELRVNLNTTDYYYVRLFAYENLDWTGSYTYIPVYGTGWQTIGKDVSHEIGSLKLILQLSDAKPGPINIQVDYISIGRENQVGDTGTISTDGDEVTLTADADGSIFAFDIDTTATAAQLATAYYPFLGLDFNDADSSDYVTVETYDGTNYFTVLDNVTLGTDPLHCNIQAVDTYISQFWITLAADAVVRLDWIKGHSIANWSITLTSDTINDYLYVDSGALYSSIDSGYIEANHDPTLNLSQYHDWNMDTSLGTPEIDFYDDVWLGYSTETEGEFLIGSIVTDFRLKFTDNANIISLEFSVMAELELSIFEELFLSTEMWGYFGPLGLVIIGYLLIKKDKALGIFMFIVDCLVIAHYLSLVGATPAYWWHIFILLFGVIQCTIQLLDR